jgi:hypothetical protein
VINNVYHTAYHKTTMHSSKTPYVTRCRLTSQYTVYYQQNTTLVSIQQVTNVKEIVNLSLCHLRNGNTQVVQGNRLKFFRNASWEVTEEAKGHLYYLEDKLFVVDHFLYLRKRRKHASSRFIVKALQRVIPFAKWEPFADMEEDA